MKVYLFLDVAKAFDRHYHDGLIYKMEQLRYPPAITQMLASILEDRHFRVRVGFGFSIYREIEAMVHKSPLLYCIYIAEFRDTTQYYNETALLGAQSLSADVAINRVEDAADDVLKLCVK